MSLDHGTDVIAALMKVARPVIRTTFRQDSCIPSTRIGIDVLAYFGLKAVPMPLFMLIYNDEAMKLIEGGKAAQLQELMHSRGPDEPGGPWSVGVGAEIANSSGWAGHLVVGLPEYRVLIDLSIDQASRPHKGIDLPIPMLFLVGDDDWWSGKETRWTSVLVNDRGERLAIIMDRTLKDPGGYRRSPNWQRDSGIITNPRKVFKDITGQIIREMKVELEGESA